MRIANEEVYKRIKQEMKIINENAMNMKTQICVIKYRNYIYKFDLQCIFKLSRYQSPGYKKELEISHFLTT